MLLHQDLGWGDVSEPHYPLMDTPAAPCQSQASMRPPVSWRASW